MTRLGGRVGHTGDVERGAAGGHGGRGGRARY